MSGHKLIIGFITLTLAIIFGGIAFISQTDSPDLKVSKEAHAQIPITSYDWGQIPINNGKVTKTFEITNSGPNELQLANLVTSCMCTTVQVIINDQASPFFGMHSKSSWLGKVATGEKAAVVIEFDPLFHGPNSLGQISRQVTVETNDPQNPKITFTLTGNVIN